MSAKPQSSSLAASQALLSEHDADSRLRHITENLGIRLAGTAHKTFETGLLLLQAKELLGYGNFRNWLSEHFNMSAKTANRFMAVAQMVERLALAGERVTLLDQLELTALYELAAKSTPAEIQNRVLARLEAGQPVTHEAIRLLKLQAQPAPAQPMAPVELQRFTGLLEAFSVWFKLNRRSLENSSQPLDESFKKDLQAYSNSLKEATALIEALLESKP